MRYILSETIVEAGERRKPGEAEEVIEIMTVEQFKEQEKGLPHRHFLLRSLENPVYCKAELFGSCVLGTFSIPRRNALWGEKIVFGYYMTPERLIFVDAGTYVKSQIDRMREIVYGREAGIFGFFLGFLDYVIRDDALFLQKYEQQLSSMEEKLLEGVPKNFYEAIIGCRKEIIVLHAYYDQLVNLAEALSANTNQMMTQEQCQGFWNFAKRCARLHDQTENLREYLMQIREMYQTQIDIGQNRTMNLLAVLSAIFLPLTLMAGWYGMNFRNMPELGWKYGYPVMIAASAVIVGLEILYFRKKKLI